MLTSGVTVVIPTYNRADLLGEALESVFVQSYRPLEIVVVDDGSTDNTSAVLDAYTLVSPVPLRVIVQENQGESAARNAGILSASHRLVAFLDSDNRWRPGKLTSQMQLFVADPALPFSFTAYEEFGDTEPAIVRLEEWDEHPPYPLRALLRGCCINTSTVVADRTVLVNVGLFSTELVCCQDHDLWLRVAAAGHRIGYSGRPLTEYRIHGGSVSGDAALVARSTLRVFQRLFDDDVLPEDVRLQRNRHLAWCHLNSACAHLSLGDGRSARSDLMRAVQLRPRSARPGWLRLFGRSFVVRSRADD